MFHLAIGRRWALRLRNLPDNRARLAGLIAEAAENGSRFNDEAVFRERSELIRRYS